jgi:hypothetical protein
VTRNVTWNTVISSGQSCFYCPSGYACAAGSLWPRPCATTHTPVLCLWYE